MICDDMCLSLRKPKRSSELCAVSYGGLGYPSSSASLAIGLFVNGAEVVLQRLASKSAVAKG